MNIIDYKNLVSFSKYFNVSKDDVSRLGFFDVTLSVDSKLYIDPKLVRNSKAVGFEDASENLTKAFSTLFTLIGKSNSDPYYDAAIRQLSFKELRGTCLGYSDENVNGSCIGNKIRQGIVDRIKGIIDAGHVDYEIFELLDIFVDGFGCDRTSDFIAHFIIKNIIKYNLFVINELKLLDKPMIKVGDSFLLRNPIRKDLPIMLLPRDILSDLPVFYSFEDLDYISNTSDEARKNLQSYIDLDDEWNKDKTYNLLTHDKAAYETIIKAYRISECNPYSFEDDKRAFCKFRDIILEKRENHPEVFENIDDLDKADLYSVVKKCVSVFKHLVEKCGLRNSVREYDEKVAQNLFLATSYIYCIDNKISILPECNSGRGPVDFVFTNGGQRMSVELKKSSNTNYCNGLKKQLPEYMDSNQSIRGFFLFFNVDSKESNKVVKILQTYSEIEKPLKEKIDLEIIECFAIPSASKWFIVVKESRIWKLQ